MKRLISVMLAIMMSCATAAVAADGEGAYTLSSSAGVIKPGDEFTVSFDIDTLAEIKGIQCTIEYDLTLFGITDCTVGEAFDGAVMSDVRTEKRGEIDIYAAYMSAQRVSGNVCEVKFAVSENAYGGEAEIKLGNILLADADEKGSRGEEFILNMEIDGPAKPAATDNPISTHAATLEPVERNSPLPTNAPSGATPTPTARPSHGSTGGGGPRGSTNSSTEKPTAPAETSKPAKETPSATEEVTPHVFSDTKGHWAQNEIEALYATGIISGVTDTLFEPERSVTRAEFTKLVVSALDIQPKPTDVFVDVPADAWYNPYVGAAVEKGIVEGSYGEFRPDDSITRQEMAAVIYRAFGVGAASGKRRPFEDEADIAPWAIEAVDALTDAGVINGTDDGFEPENDTTRAQAATVLYRILFK